MKAARQPMDRMTPVACRPAGTRPSATPEATPSEGGLVRWISLALIAVGFVSMLSPVLASLDANMTRITGQLHEREIVPAAVSTPYGVCADLCTLDGNCRYVVVPNGWHRGTHVSDQQIVQAHVLPLSRIVARALAE